MPLTQVKNVAAIQVLQLVALLWGILLLVAGCRFGPGASEDTLFQRIHVDESGIDFTNDLSFSDEFNIFTYTDFYAGGGVALGDINNDGLLDIYLVANQKDNKLYLNKGDFEFEDITEQAGVAGDKPWSTGVSLVDINGDGLLDIYVSNAGTYRGRGHEENRSRNELFVNKGDLTFTESAEEYGIDDDGNSIHASFFDYDNDRDVDLYILNNHNSKPIGEYNISNNQREEVYFKGGDRLYSNELVRKLEDGGVSGGGVARFTDVTEDAGIYSSEIGFGLGVSVGDLNKDGWMDLYISNDFFERDYMYLNNGDGTFDEVLEERLGSISTSSMGGDVADIDNDGWVDIFITDMLPSREDRIKTMSDFVDWGQFQSEIEMGYYRKFLRNTMQYNNSDGTFSEIGRYAGVEATDWSWGALMADLDMDGMRDIFVPNGVYKDETNKDFIVATTKREVMKDVVVNNKVNYEKLLEMIPTSPISNFVFENQGGMRFQNRASAWGLGEPSFSNGAAYGDLDGDGDLDLVVNNVNMESFVYRNRASELYPDRSWIQLVLEGEPPNTLGVGTQVELIAGDRRWYTEQIPQRGFQSSVDPTLHVGLGAGIPTIDTLKVRWPDGRVSLQRDVETNQRLVIRQDEARDNEQVLSELFTREEVAKADPLLGEATEEVGFNWKHEEAPYDDFDQSPLLFHMRSTEGPALCTGDVDGDGREDVYVGGARSQSGALFLHRADGQFEQTAQPAFEADASAEDTDCEFFDADRDGTPELYVASGSSEFPAGSEDLSDRLYEINSQGRLVRSEDALPRLEDGHKPTGVVRAADLDGDGDQDLFVGTRMTPVGYGAALGYGVPVGGYILANNGAGEFEDATDQLAPQLHAQELKAAGITDARWGDLNGDEAPDLVVVGEWMPLTVFLNRDGKLEWADAESVGLENTRGWWQSLAIADLNGDGALDLVGGNHGLNSRFRASPEQPVQMWGGDFDRDGQIEHVFASYNDGDGPYPVALRQNMIQQLPYLKSRYSTFSDYAETKVPEMFSQDQLEEAEHYRAEQLASVVAWNNGNGSFSIDSLPFRAQLAPMYGTLAEDLDGDEVLEILMGGNLHAAQPQAGRYDASYGVLLRQDSSGSYRDIPSQESGFFSPGEIRAIQSLEHNGQTFVIVGRNDDSLQVFGVNSE